jgi:hypothetical protein
MSAICWRLETRSIEVRARVDEWRYRDRAGAGWRLRTLIEMHAGRAAIRLICNTVLEGMRADGQLAEHD